MEKRVAPDRKPGKRSRYTVARITGNFSRIPPRPYPCAHYDIHRRRVLFATGARSVFAARPIPGRSDDLFKLLIDNGDNGGAYYTLAPYYGRPIDRIACRRDIRRTIGRIVLFLFPAGFSVCFFFLPPVVHTSFTRVWSGLRFGPSYANHHDVLITRLVNYRHAHTCTPFVSKYKTSISIYIYNPHTHTHI